MEKLRHYVPDELLGAAKRAAGSEAAGPLADAHWIKAALAAKADGAVAGRAAVIEAQHATDQDGEVAWLVRVAAAYKTIPEGRAREVLASTQSHTQETSA